MDTGVGPVPYLVFHEPVAAVTPESVVSFQGLDLISNKFLEEKGRKCHRIPRGFLKGPTPTGYQESGAGLVKQQQTIQLTENQGQTTYCFDIGTTSHPSCFSDNLNPGELTTSQSTKGRKPLSVASTRSAWKCWVTC